MPCAAVALFDPLVRASMCDMLESYDDLRIADGAFRISGVPLADARDRVLAELTERLLDIGPHLAGVLTHGPYR